MHANVAKAPARAVYVPAPRRPAPEPEEPKPSRLPRHLAVASASAVFRGVPWTGEPEELEPVLPPADRVVRSRVPSSVKARELFAQVRWTGDAPGEPTQAQRINSVHNVFNEFGWE
jgi:hypothetical protein